MKKVLVSLMILLSLCCLFGCETAQKEEVHIFYTSDVHCGVNENVSFGGLQTLLKERKAVTSNVLLVDCGDFLQGGNLGVLTKGEAIVDLMNAMHYDIVTLGNHEFDYGMERLAELIQKGDFETICCNMDYTGQNENLFADMKGYTTRTFGGTKIAFVAVLTPTAPVESTPAFFKEDGEFVYDFCNGEEGKEVARRVQENVDKAIAEKADVVILMSHMGSEPEYAPYDIISLIANTHGIDAVIDGHSHSVIDGTPYPNDKGEDVLLTSVGTKMENVGEMIIDKEGNISCILYSEVADKDEEIETLMNESFAKLDSVLSEKLAHSAFALPITNENGVRICRSREVALGSMVCDMLLEVFGADATVFNGGSIRKALPEGDITYGDALNVMPFSNHFLMIETSGQSILDCLEFGAQKTQGLEEMDGNAVGESGAFIHVGGLRYTIDTSVANPVLFNDDNMMSSIEGERRVRDVEILIDGSYQPLDPEKTYLVAGADYILLKDGDGNTSFHDATVVKELDLTDLDVFCSWLKEIGEIPEKYAKTEGRITVK